MRLGGKKSLVCHSASWARKNSRNRVGEKACSCRWLNYNEQQQVFFPLSSALTNVRRNEKYEFQTVSRRLKAFPSFKREGSQGCQVTHRRVNEVGGSWSEGSAGSEIV